MKLLLFIAFGVFGILAVGFLVIARKGRKLRTAHALPDEAASALLEAADGKQYKVNRDSHFYVGADPSNDLILPEAPREYTVCIFYHRKRFAFQTLSSSRGIRVNADEVMAGYLANGDVLEIAGKQFTFRCY